MTNETVAPLQQGLVKTVSIHLICGPVAAGKSTYANRLANEIGGIVLAIDEWMGDLFVPDIPAQTSVTAMDFSWFTNRVDRCETNMWRIGRRLLANGTPLVLDWGFIRRDRRDKARAYAASLGADVRLHYLTAAAETRRLRLAERNRRQGETYAFAVTPEMFAFAEQMFEPPQDAELNEATVVSC